MDLKQLPGRNLRFNKSDANIKWTKHIWLKRRCCPDQVYFSNLVLNARHQWGRWTIDNYYSAIWWLSSWPLSMSGRPELITKGMFPFLPKNFAIKWKIHGLWFYFTTGIRKIMTYKGLANRIITIFTKLGICDVRLGCWFWEHNQSQLRIPMEIIMFLLSTTTEKLSKMFFW